MSKSTRLFLLSLLVFTFLISTAYAAGSKLIFSDVDVKVGSRTSKNLVDGERIDDEAEPGDTVEFRIEVRNNFTSQEGLKIEDVSVEVTIEAIDDGDDLDDESSEFDLRPGRDKRVTLKFEVPLEVEEDDFEVIILASGQDENGTDHDAEMRLTLEVNKESHKLEITRNALSPAEVSCNRRNIQLSAQVINIGNEDEDDVTVQLLSPELGVDLKEDIDELTAEPNEDESRFSKIFLFNVPNDAEAGSYPVTLRALYNNDRRKAEETATLTVNDCAAAQQQQKAAEEEPKKEESVELIMPATGRATTGTGFEQALPEGAVTTQESFFKSNIFITAIIIAEVIAVIVGIAVIASLFRRRG